jgi:hypothetical protein
MQGDWLFLAFTLKLKHQPFLVSSLPIFGLEFYHQLSWFSDFWIWARTISLASRVSTLLIHLENLGTCQPS